MFQCTIELLSEGYLIRRNVTLAGTVTTATLHLANALEKRKHDAKTLDYYTDMAEAKTAKDPSRIFQSR
jgi:hypothetical protein